MAMGKSPYVEDLKPCEWISSGHTNLLYAFLKNNLTKEDTILSMLKKNFKRLGNSSVCYDQIF